MKAIQPTDAEQVLAVAVELDKPAAVPAMAPVEKPTIKRPRKTKAAPEILK